MTWKEFSKRFSVTGNDHSPEHEQRRLELLIQLDAPIGHCAELRTWVKGQNSEPTPGCTWPLLVLKLADIVLNQQDLIEQLYLKGTENGRNLRPEPTEPAEGP